MTLGKQISRLRAAKGLSQEDLANDLQVSRQSISKWETDTSVPELDKLLKLSEVFGVTLDELVKGPAEEAAQAIDARVTAKEIAQRRDFRGVTTFTVDPADAKDFDDALSIRPIKDGLWEVGVHIADVTHYVKEGGIIDKEAEKILSDARKRALENENKIVENAKEEAAAIIERARTEAELEKQKAADDMKREMVVLASMMAGKVVKASIDTTVQESLINDTLKEIGESTWQS